MILLVDNYDSFTWNLYQQMAGLGAEVEVLRNDVHDAAGFLALGASAVVLSPGPGRPSDAGVCRELIARLPAGIPLLGVCLGHQALVEHYGGSLERDPVPVHGKSAAVHHDGGELFADLSSPFEAGRYHSLRARRDSLPACLELSAWTEDGLVMAVRHRELPRFGVQFHPESVLTPQGTRLMAQFLTRAGEGTLSP
ncbi:MAG TPA: aminodeoxychorismate/anthranilate synthase component II [Planctomycetota bacterium]|nr:aminodeoxychorismate/anthranilate synthase component II [Planctomycetota bacterium]